MLFRKQTVRTSNGNSPTQSEPRFALGRRRNRPLKIALLTNVATKLSLPILKSLSESATLQLCHVLFYDTVSEAKGSWRKVLREQGVKAATMKVSHWLARSARTLCRDKLAWPVGQCQYSYEYAVAHNLQFSVFADMNQPAVVSLLKRLQVDILLVCSCGQLLKKHLLAAPHIAAINLHPSLLPKYRGPRPVFWTLYHEELQAGVTFHLMTERIDDGDVIAQFKVPIGTKVSEQALSNRLFETAAARVEHVLHDFAHGDIKPQPQTRHDATYQSYPTAGQRRQLVGRTR